MTGEQAAAAAPAAPSDLMPQPAASLSLAGLIDVLDRADGLAAGPRTRAGRPAGAGGGPAVPGRPERGAGGGGGAGPRPPPPGRAAPPPADPPPTAARRCAPSRCGRSRPPRPLARSWCRRLLRRLADRLR